MVMGIIGLAWGALSVVLGVFIGKMIKRRDRDFE
jgi:hypothetical protein